MVRAEAVSTRPPAVVKEAAEMGSTTKIGCAEAETRQTARVKEALFLCSTHKVGSYFNPLNLGPELSIYRWMQYGNVDKNYMSHREFSFTLEDDIYLLPKTSRFLLNKFAISGNVKYIGSRDNDDTLFEMTIICISHCSMFIPCEEQKFKSQSRVLRIEGVFKFKILSVPLIFHIMYIYIEIVVLIKIKHRELSRPSPKSCPQLNVIKNKKPVFGLDIVESQVQGNLH